MQKCQPYTDGRQLAQNLNSNVEFGNYCHFIGAARLLGLFVGLFY